VFTVVTFSQVNTLSPYTRLGLGELNSPSYGRSNAMGDLNSTLRAPNQINIGNPASYSAQDTLSFIFDVGIKNQLTTYKQADQSIKFNSSSIDHLAIGFPITRQLKMSGGIYPYSSIGYEVETLSPTVSEDYNRRQTNMGTGGVNKLYLGAGYELINGLSVGFNVFYLFGNLDYENISTLTDAAYVYRIVDEKKTRIDGVTFNTGIQYDYSVSEDLKFRIGGTFQPKTKLKSKYTFSTLKQSVIQGSNDAVLNLETDTISIVESDQAMEMPFRMSGGIAIEFQEKLFIGTDFAYQNWESFSYPTLEGNLNNSIELSLGAQYIPNPKAFSGYFNLVQYRLGGFYKQSYLTVNSEQLNDIGVTAGLGLPLRGGKSILNVSYKYGKYGTTTNNLIQENYNQINIGFSFYDFWFIKSKYD
jgi:hypothetical protein